MWTPQSVEGLPGIGSLLELRVAVLSGSEDLWITGTDSLLRARPEALSPRPPPRPPAIRAWATSTGAKPEGAVAGTLPLLHPEHPRRV